MRQPLIFGWTLWWALPLVAQTEGTVTREGRYWVQALEASMQTAGAPNRLRVNSVGPIAVRGDGGDQIRYTVRKRVRAGSEAEARRLLARAQVRASRQGSTYVLSVDPLDCARCSFSADVKMTTPRATAETILETHGGGLEVYDVDGKVIAETAGGSIQMDRIGRSVRAATAGGQILLGAIGGPVHCETAGGTIKLGSVRGDASLTTSGGDIDAEQVDGALRAQTAGGSIRVRRVAHNVIAETAGGSIYLGQIGGSVSAETAGGSITVEKAPLGVRAENASGSIRLMDVAGALRAATAAGNIVAYLMANQPLQNSMLETSMGTIEVLIPQDLKLTIRADIEAASSANRIQCDFPDINIRMQEQGPGTRVLIAEGAINGGGPMLRLRNTTGVIRILRR